MARGKSAICQRGVAAHAMDMSVVEVLEDRRLFAVAGGVGPVGSSAAPVVLVVPTAQPAKTEPLNTGGVTYNAPAATPTPTPTTPTPTPTPTTPTPTPTTPTPTTPTPTPTTPTPTTPTPTTPTPTTPTPTTPTPTTPTPTTPTPTMGPVPAVDNDDELTEAGSITLGSTRTAVQIGRDTDVDLYKISLTAGDVIAIDVDNVAGFSTFNGRLRLFDGLGAQVATSDDNAGPGEVAGLEPFLAFTVPATGVYYVGVSGAANAAYVTTTGAGDTPASFGPYTLTTSRAGLLNDRDDQIGEADLIGSDATKNAKLSTLTDVDMYRLTAGAGHRFLITVAERNDSNVDAAIQIFNASGERIADDSSSPGSIDFLAPLAGNYYIGVSGKPNRDYNVFLGTYASDKFGSTGDYRLTVDRT